MLFLGTGAILPYLSVWLDGRGLTGEQIGLALGLAMVARFFSAVSVGYLADASGFRRRFFRSAAGILVVAYALHLPAHGVLAITLAVALAGAATAPLTPLLEAFAIGGARRRGFSYGPVRSVGSAAFIVSSLVVGVLIDRLGGEAVIPYVIATGLGLVVAAGFLPADPRPQKGSKLDPGLISELLRAPVAAALAASALVQGGHAFYYGFSTLSWRAQGFSDVLIGSLWAWGVIAEILFLLVVAPRAERLGPARLLAFGAVSGIVRWTVLAFAPGPGIAFLVQTLHAGTFAAAHLGLVTFIGTRVGERAAATAQSLNSALTLGGVLAGATALSGVLFDAYAARGYLAMTGLCAAGLAAALLLMRLERSAARV